MIARGLNSIAHNFQIYLLKYYFDEIISHFYKFCLTCLFLCKIASFQNLSSIKTFFWKTGFLSHISIQKKLFFISSLDVNRNQLLMTLVKIGHNIHKFVIFLEIMQFHQTKHNTLSDLSNRMVYLLILNQKIITFMKLSINIPKLGINGLLISLDFLVFSQAIDTRLCITLINNGYEGTSALLIFRTNCLNSSLLKGNWINKSTTSSNNVKSYFFGLKNWILSDLSKTSQQAPWLVPPLNRCTS